MQLFCLLMGCNSNLTEHDTLRIDIESEKFECVMVLNCSWWIVADIYFHKKYGGKRNVNSFIIILLAIQDLICSTYVGLQK